MPFLISKDFLEWSCPGAAIDPIGPADSVTLHAANGSSLQLIGSIDLHFRFSGPSFVSGQDGTWAMTGPVMQYWYPACAAVFQNLNTPLIMSA